MKQSTLLKRNTLINGNRHCDKCLSRLNCTKPISGVINLSYFCNGYKE